MENDIERYYDKRVFGSYSNVEKSFGWQLVDTHSTSKRVGHHRRYDNSYTCLRDRRMPNYDKLVELERKYRELDASIDNKVPSVDVPVAIILLLLFVIPGLLYIFYKNSKKKQVETRNDSIKYEMRKILNKASSLSQTTGQ